MTHFTIHRQEWHTLTRYILSCEEGTITLELYKKPQGEKKIQAYICNLWVKEQYRHRAIASMLLLEVEKIAREDGHKEVWLEWDRRDTERFVLDWYMRNGYDDKAFGNNQVLLKKEL